MMEKIRIKLTVDTSIGGDIVKAKSVITVDAKEARRLFASGKAVPAGVLKRGR